MENLGREFERLARMVNRLHEAEVRREMGFRIAQEPALFPDPLPLDLDLIVSLPPASRLTRALELQRVRDSLEKLMTVVEAAVESIVER